MNSVRERVEELGEFLVGQAEASDQLGRLTDEAAKQLAASGIVKMLQPKEFGGSESSPVEFFEAVMEVGRHYGSAGWVSGVVGIHPFEIAQASRQVQQEIWGEDEDTWVASPYAPFGRAKRVDGGYRFTGRWSFSSGTDHCDWIVLGGLIVDEDGKPLKENADRHFILPRADYRIVEDSWQVVGLKGTGSKDVVIEDAFIPDHRVIDPRDLETGKAARQAGRGGVALYRMPFHTMFGTIIAAGTLALADGALDAFVEYTRTRVTAKGVHTASDAHHLNVLGGAAADIQAGRRHFISDQERLWDLAQADRPIPKELRAEVRRNQVAAVRRSSEAVDRLVAKAGGGAMRLDNPLQRFWRDLHTAQNHQANQTEQIYVNHGLTLFGQPLPKGTRL